MINLTAGPRSFVVAAIALLACLLVGLATAAPSHASTGVDVAIDTDVTGNNARGPIGAADNCVAVSPGSRFTVDITAEVPPDDATAGFQFDLLYNSSLLNVVGVDNARMMQAPADQAFDYTDPLPDHDGDLLASYVELDGGTKSGEGVLSSITFEAEAAGASALELSNLLIVDSSGGLMQVTQIRQAAVAIGGSCEGVPVPSPVLPTPLPPQTPTPTPFPTSSISPGHVVPTYLRIDSATAIPGGAITVGIYAELGAEELGSFTFDVWYDNSVLAASSCRVFLGSATDCNTFYSPSVVRFGGATATGWAGSVELGSITFGALRTGTGDLIIQPVEWNDSLGSDIRGGLTTGQGVVGVDSPDPPLTPTPICCRVTPSANPTLVIESPRASGFSPGAITVSPTSSPASAAAGKDGKTPRPTSASSADSDSQGGGRNLIPWLLAALSVLPAAGGVWFIRSGLARD